MIAFESVSLEYDQNRFALQEVSFAATQTDRSTGTTHRW